MLTVSSKKTGVSKLEAETFHFVKYKFPHFSNSANYFLSGFPFLEL